MSAAALAFFSAPLLRIPNVKFNVGIFYPTHPNSDTQWLKVLDGRAIKHLEMGKVWSWDPNLTNASYLRRVSSILSHSSTVETLIIHGYHIQPAQLEGTFPPVSGLSEAIPASSLRTYCGPYHFLAYFSSFDNLRTIELTGWYAPHEATTEEYLVALRLPRICNSALSLKLHLLDHQAVLFELIQMKFPYVTHLAIFLKAALSRDQVSRLTNHATCPINRGCQTLNALRKQLPPSVTHFHLDFGNYLYNRNRIPKRILKDFFDGHQGLEHLQITIQTCIDVVADRWEFYPSTDLIKTKGRFDSSITRVSNIPSHSFYTFGRQ